MIGGPCLLTEPNKDSILWLKLKVTALLLWFPLVKTWELSGFAHHKQDGGRECEGVGQTLSLLQRHSRSSMSKHGRIFQTMVNQVTGITWVWLLVETENVYCLAEGRGGLLVQHHMTSVGEFVLILEKVPSCSFVGNVCILSPQFMY